MHKYAYIYSTQSVLIHNTMLESGVFLATWPASLLGLLVLWRASNSTLASYCKEIKIREEDNELFYLLVVAF